MIKTLGKFCRDRCVRQARHYANASHEVENRADARCVTAGARYLPARVKEFGNDQIWCNQIAVIFEDGVPSAIEKQPACDARVDNERQRVSRSSRIAAVNASTSASVAFGGRMVFSHATKPTPVGCAPSFKASSASVCTECPRRLARSLRASSMGAGTLRMRRSAIFDIILCYHAVVNGPLRGRTSPVADVLRDTRR